MTRNLRCRIFLIMLWPLKYGDGLTDQVLAQLQRKMVKFPKAHPGGNKSKHHGDDRILERS
jgi:hypothetical protein